MKKLIKSILLISILFSVFTVTHIANAENSSPYDYSSFVGSWYNEDFSWGTSYESKLDEIRICSVNNNYITLSIIEKGEGTELVSGIYQIIDNQITWIDSDYFGNPRPKHILTFNDDSISYTENGSDKVLCFTSNVIKPRKTTVENYSVVLNGQKLEFDQPPIMKDDRILVPFRVILEAMNADVYYDRNNDVGSNYTVISAVKNNIVVQISNSSYGWGLTKSNYDNENYEVLEFDTMPIILNGRTLVPIRVLAECFGADVSWNGTSGTVNITANISGNKKSAEEIKKADNFTGMIAHKIAESTGLPVGSGISCPYFNKSGKYFHFIVFDNHDINIINIYANGKIEQILENKVMTSNYNNPNFNTLYSGKWNWDKSEPLLDNKENWYTYDEAWVDISLVDLDSNTVSLSYYHQMGGTHLYTYDECIGYIQGNKITAKTKARKGDQAFDDFTITCTFYDNMMWLEAYNDTQGGLAFSGTFYK